MSLSQHAAARWQWGKPGQGERANCHIAGMARYDTAVTKPLINGALAGLIATVPMTLFMLYCHKRLPVLQRYPLPPSLITQRAVRGFGAPYPSPIPNLFSTLAAHFGFGAVAGILFAVAPAALRRQNPVNAGIIYGLAVWAGSYFGWVPGLRLMTPANRQPAARNAMMIAAHVVWGATLGLALETFHALSARNRSEAKSRCVESTKGPPRATPSRTT